VSCLNFDITASPKFFRVFFSTIKPKIATVAHLLPVAVWIKRIFWNTGWIARVASQPVPARPADAAATSATLTFKHPAESSSEKQRIAVQFSKASAQCAIYRMSF
jgi:hypothetical protein